MICRRLWRFLATLISSSAIHTNYIRLIQSVLSTDHRVVPRVWRAIGAEWFPGIGYQKGLTPCASLRKVSMRGGSHDARWGAREDTRVLPYEIVEPQRRMVSRPATQPRAVAPLPRGRGQDRRGSGLPPGSQSRSSSIRLAPGRPCSPGPPRASPTADYPATG